MILDEIAVVTKKRIEKQKEIVSLEDIKRKALSMPRTMYFPFEKALRTEEMSFICEVKKASPSKNVIAEDFDYCKIAMEYERAFASAISVLTEPTYFQGSNAYLAEINRQVLIPTLRKDFTVDEYMIYEAKTLQASAILLICAILTDDQLKRYMEIAHELGMSALVECHSEGEVERALNIDARIIGVNNRDLQTFEVDTNTSLRLRHLVPKEKLFISESGIQTAEDVAKLYECGVDGVLIGETLMRSGDKSKKIRELRSGCGG